jgi:arylsulfatase A-like enzyme
MRMSMKYVKFLIYNLPLLAMGFSVTANPDRPNVVIVLIDDMGYGDLSCYGNKFVNTPNIDALASNGLKFTNYYVNSPICSPSRVAMNTGQYPMRYRIHSFIASSRQNENRAMANYLDLKAPTLARTLHDTGYATGHFGKWHMGGGRDVGNVPYPTEYGFDESFVSFEGIGNRVLFPNDDLCAQSAKLGKGEITWAEKHQSTKIYVDKALSFIQRSGDKPFYINLCPNDVHDPHLPDPATIKKWMSVTENPYEQKFFAVLEELDKQIGRFISELQKSGKLENTLILVASDNGPTDWSYYYYRKKYPDGYQGKIYPPGSAGIYSGRKWSLYEGGIREPFIVYWKGHLTKGAIDSTTIISAIDIFPSVCSALGVKPPEGLDGTDKCKSFGGKPIKKVPPLMWEYGSNPGGSILPGNLDNKSPNLAIRDGNWKLLINVDGTGAQLFNLKEDPAEKNNLAEKEERIVEKLRVRLINWRKSMPVEMKVN